MKNIWMILCLLLLIYSCKNNDEQESLKDLYPEIFSIESNIFPGDTIMISGKNFASEVTVFFGQTVGKVVNSTSNQINVIVPDGKGCVYVKVLSKKYTSNSRLITYGFTGREYNFTLSGMSYHLDTAAYYKIGPGATYLALDLVDINKVNPLKIYIISVDVNDPYVTFKPILANDSILTGETVPRMAVRKSSDGMQYFAGVNGDYFDMSSSKYGKIDHSCMIDGEIIKYVEHPSFDGPWYYAPVVFDNNKKMSIGDILYTGSITLPNGSKVTINHVNEIRGENQMVLYTPVNGVSTRANNAGTEIVVIPVKGWGNYKNVQVKVAEIRPGNLYSNALIPKNGAVLSCQGTAETLIKAVRVNDELTINSYITMPSPSGTPKQLICGPSPIMKGAHVYSSSDVTRQPRTGIGTNVNKSKVYMIVVDGRWAGASAGVTIPQFADIMKLYGITDAVNLDGGGSSTMYIKNAGLNGLVNRPTGGTYMRPVGNGIFAVSTAPNDNILTEITPVSYTVIMKKGSSIVPELYGLNKYGSIITKFKGGTGVSLSALSALGTVSGNTFTATSVGRAGILTITYNNMKTKMKIITE